MNRESGLVGYLLKRKKIIVNFAIYFSTYILNKAIPFILLPIFARYLEPEDFGKLAIFTTAIIFMKPVLDLALCSFVTIEFYQRSKEYLASLNASILAAIFSNFVVVTFLFVGARFLVGNFLELPLTYYFLIPIVCLTSSVFLLHLIILRNSHKAFEFGVLQVLGTIINFSTSILLIVFLKYDWSGRALAEVAANGSLAIISLFFLAKYKYISSNLSFEKLKEAFSFSLPLVFSILFISMISYVDRFFIREMVGERALGIYAIGFSFGMILKSIINSFEQVFVPWIFQHLSNKDKQKIHKIKLVRFTYIYSFFLLILSLCVGIGGNILLLLGFLPDKYLGAGEFIFWIALSFSLWGIANVFSPYIGITKKTRYTLLSTGIGCTINLILNFALIRHFGTIGAAYSKVITVITIVGLYFFFANRLYPMPWFDYKAFKISLSDLKEFVKIRK